MAENPGRLHADRGRALSFGGVAAMYDKARPSYPAALVDALMAFAPRNVLDVGCGTGKASQLFIDRGCDVLGVEPDPAMAAIARSHGVRIEEGAFEEWDPRGRMYDLIVSGQAWHWVDPEVGPAKAASVLHPGGHLAMFWNRGRPDAAIAAEFDAIYQRVAPAIARDTGALNPSAEPGDRFAQLANVGQFSNTEARTYEWDATYNRASWTALISTQSDHVLLPDAQRQELLDALGAAIDAAGGTLPYHYSTLLVLATRSS
jgi:SAM-dependent methyltransferase